MIIGIDTSCYTTSFSLIGEDGRISEDFRILLRVKPGERGLRQSEAVFQHLQNLPELLESLDGKINISGVAAAVTPRPVPESYLPVFKVGESFGRSLAKVLGAPFLPFSHQEGHLRAGLYLEEPPTETFLAWHLSGGTTELLQVDPQASGGYTISKIGGSSDLQVGQLVDRIGVALGLSFPAGPGLEKLAATSNTKESLPVVTNDLGISFSGPAAAGERLIAAAKLAESDIARQVFNCISRSVLKVTLRALERFRAKKVVFVGGVASNLIIREFLAEQITGSAYQFIFAPAGLSSDNAVGVGLLGYDSIWKGKK